MVEEGILSENGLAESKGGRRAQLFSFTKDIFYTMAVSINQFHTTIAVFDLNGEPVGESWSKNIQLSKSGEDLIERSEEHTSELQSRGHLVCRLLLEKKKE